MRFNTRTLSKKGFLATGMVLFAITCVLAFTVHTASSHSGDELGSTENQSEHANDRAQSARRPDDPGSQAGTKLADAKLKACHNREKAINNIMARIADRGQKHLDLFTTIATRVEDFYAEKGKTLDNYDELVADVEAKQAAAQTVVDEVTSNSVVFECDGTDPKGAAKSFKADLKSEISALQAYRTAVKNLIVGVASVQGTTSSSDNDTQGGQE